MPKIRIDMNTTPSNGRSLTFKSPADCSNITGLIVYYPNGETTSSKEFKFVDSHGVDVGKGTVSLFAKNAFVKIIFDTDNGLAFVQNADTNDYLEGKLAEKYSPENKPSLADVGAAPAGFGLGECAKLLTADVDLNTCLKGGWYSWRDSTPINAPDPWCMMEVIPFGSSEACLQRAYCIVFGQENLIRQRFMRGWGTWTPWEYVNPPMRLGVEYRTTERIDGKAVYKKNDNGVIKYRLDGETEWKDLYGTTKTASGTYVGRSDLAQSVTTGFKPKFITACRMDTGERFFYIAGDGTKTFNEKTNGFDTGYGSASSPHPTNMPDVTYTYFAIG